MEDDLTVSWSLQGTNVPEPTAYEITWKDATADTPQTVATLPSTAHEYTISGIEADTRYEIDVVAIYQGVERYAGEIALRFNVPREPKIESIEATETSIKLTWEAPPVDTGTIKRPVDGYELSWRIDAAGAVLSSKKLDKDVQEYRIDDLVSGTDYVIALSGHNGLGVGGAFIRSIATDSIAPSPTATPTPTPTPTPTATATPTPTPTPTEVVATLRVVFERLVEDDLTVSWSLQGTNVPEPTAYEITWKDATADTPQTVATLPSTAHEYTISGIEADTRYEIDVVAIYQGVERYAGEIALRFNVPREPKIESIEATETSIKLTWEAPPVDTGTIKRPVDGYELSWRIDAAGAVLSSKKLDKDVQEYRIDDLVSGTDYVIALSGHNGLGVGGAFIRSIATDSIAPSPTATPTPTVTPSLENATEIKFAGLESDAAVIEWSPQVIQGAEFTGFELTWTPLTDKAPSMPVKLPASTRSYKIIGVEPNIRYEIEVTALYDNDESTIEDMAFILDVPRKPDVRVDRATSNAVRLQWDAPDDSKNVLKRPVLNYELSWRRSGVGQQTSKIRLGGGATSFTIESLLASTTYEIALQVSNSFGKGGVWIGSITTDAKPIDKVGTSTSTPTPSIDPRNTTTTKSRRQRDTDPDPPEELGAEQGTRGIVVYWDDPQWDGGYDILSYAIDWRPESPPFSVFLPPTEQSTWLYGLKPNINYRVRVRALNRRDDSLPAALRIELTDTLVRYRRSAPFTGSISHGRSTILKNNSELPDFEIQTQPESLFWGDEMTFSIQRHLMDADLLVELMPGQFNAASDLFTVVASPHSRRSRFDNDATHYHLMMPIVICITPNLLNSIPIHSYSIVQITASSSIRVFDSSPIQEDDEIKICARIRKIDVSKNVAFAVISHQLDQQASTNSTAREKGVTSDVSLTLVVFVMSPTLILGGLAALRKSHQSPAQLT